MEKNDDVLKNCFSFTVKEKTRIHSFVRQKKHHTHANKTH